MKKLIIILFIASAAAGLYSSEKPLSYAVKSALIPGWGLVSSGEKGGYAFTAAEGAAIILTAAFYTVSNYYGNNAVDYASVYFNRNVSEFSNDLLSKMEMYISSERYNSLLPLRARDIYPDNPELQTEYIEEHLIPDSLAWEWNEEDSMDKYYEMRSKSRVYNNYFGYAATGIVLNHIVSAISTYLLTEKKQELPFEINGESQGATLGIMIGVKF